MKQVFLFAPGGGSPVPALLIVAFAALLAGYLVYAPRNIRFEVSPGTLDIRGDLFYGRTIRAADLLLPQARVVDVDRDTEYGIKMRTNGTGMRGYKAGWFRLANGQKALAFIGDPRRVLCIPTRAGYTLLLSAKEPEKLIQSLRNP
jgi:hypothetical protein